jgi:hypothetical protein
MSAASDRDKPPAKIVCKGWRSSLRHARRVDPVVECMKAVLKIRAGNWPRDRYWFAVGWLRGRGRSESSARVLGSDAIKRIESGWQPPPPKRPSESRRRSPGRAAVPGRRPKVA